MSGSPSTFSTPRLLPSTSGLDSPRVIARLRLTTSREAPATCKDWDILSATSPVFAPRRKRLLPPTPPSLDVHPKPGSHLPPPRISRTPTPAKPKRSFAVTRSRSLTTPKSSGQALVEGVIKSRSTDVSPRRDAVPNNKWPLRQLQPNVKKSRILPPEPSPKPSRPHQANVPRIRTDLRQGSSRDRDSGAVSQIPRPRRSLPVVSNNSPTAPCKATMLSEETTRMERLPTKIPVPTKPQQTEGQKSGSTSAKHSSGTSQSAENGKRRDGLPTEAKEEDDAGKKRRAEVTAGQTTAPARVTKTAATAQHPHLFYIGGSNGVQLVETPLLAMGWKRTTDKNADNFKLRWTETKGQVNFNSFKEGDQLVNHIPNCDLITNKLGLLLSLREYERVTWAVKNRPPKLQMFEFVPETYILDDKREREAFFEAHKEGDIWICKPTGWNQGKGIYLVRDLEQYKQELLNREAKINDKNNMRRPMGRIVQKISGTMVIQRYLKNPLLLEERKFDIRSYMVICSTMPFLVLYHPGYIRLSMHKYSNNSTDMTIHLTNQFIQKKDPGYEDAKNDTVWSMEKLYEYILETYGEEKKLNENIGKVIDRQIQRIMLHVFNSVRHKLAARIGFFEIYGFDFMIDTDMNVWLIEVNINPALHTNCELLREILPPIIEETLHVSIECFEKAKRHQPLLPLASLKTFQILFSTSNAVRNIRGSPQGNIKYNVTSRYRSQSQSPVRDLQQQLQTGYGPGQAVNAEQENAPRRIRQPPALAYSTRAPSYDPNSGKAPLPLPVTSQSADDSRAKPFEDSLRRYKRIDNRRAPRPSVPGTIPAPVPTQWNRSAEAQQGDETEDAEVSHSNNDALMSANSALAAALTRVAHDRTVENRRHAGGSGDLPTLGSLRMRTPRQTPRETSTTRFMPAPMTTVRVISTTGSPTPGELSGVNQLPLSHPLNQHRLKPALHALSNPPHKRARSPPDRSS